MTLPQTISFFDSIAEDWDSWELKDMPQRLERVASLAQIRHGARVLDVGTGTGIFLPILARWTESQGEVVGIDVSPKMLAVASRKPLPAWCRLVCLSFEEFSATAAPFDFVMMNAVFPHLSDAPAALKAAHGLLRPGGRLVISHPIGREAVNRIHRDAGEPVAADSVPPADFLQGWLESAGFTAVSVIDEPEFHLAMGDRPRAED